MNFNELDRLFRQKLGRRKAEFDESAWAEMEELLDKREGGRSRLGLLLILPLLLLLAGGGYFALNGGLGPADDRPKPKGSPVVKRGGPPEGNALSLPAWYPLDSIQRAAKHGPPANPTPEAGKKAAERPGNPGQARDTDANDQTIDKKAVLANPTTNQQSANQSEANSSDNPVVKEEAVPTPTNPLETSATKASLTLRKLPFKASALKPVTIDPPIANLTRDSLDALADIPEPFEWGLTGGARFAAGPNGQTFKKGSPEPTLGAYARWHLGGDWFLNAELLYRYNPRPNFEQSVTERTYGFGFDARTTRASLQETHYLELPLYVDYELMGAHGITAGIKGTWLATGSGEVTTRRFASFGDATAQSHEALLKPDGLKTWQIRAMLGYRFDYKEHWRLQVRGLWGPGRLQQRATEVGNAPEQRAAIQLMIQYQLN